MLYFGLTALFWLGHRFCSTYLAYCTEAYRPLLRTQPIRFLVLPVLITIGCFAFFLPADLALPWTRAERLVFLVIVDYAWVTWHFASQHFGALSLYRSRAGRAACVQTRRLTDSLPWSLEGCWFLSRTFSPEQSLIRNNGSIAGSFPPGWCRRRKPFVMAPLCCWSSRRSRCSGASCGRRVGRCRASYTLSVSR